MILTPKNWTSFQHYKDRAPQWIKLHRALLDDFEFASLPVGSRALAPLLWLLASEYDGGRIVASLEALAFRLRMTRGDLADALNPLLEAKFFVSTDTDEAAPAEQVATLAQRTAKSNGFGNRHISDAVKRDVWERDGGKCKSCGADDDIEYDHKVPVSKGGNSEASNVQLLCRPCNRKKRTRLAEPVEQLDTDDLSRRSLEKEEEREIEGEKRKIIRAASPSNEDFENLKKVYPRRKGNFAWKAAERKLNSLVKTGVDPKAILASARRFAVESSGKVGTEFIPMLASWLNSEDFVDAAVVAFEEAPAINWDSACEQWKSIGRWPRGHGNDPESASCRAPPEILKKHGIQPTGASQ